MTTGTAHFLVVNSAVVVSNLIFNNPNLPQSAMNGPWVVSAVVDRKNFKYKMTVDPGSYQDLNFSFAFIGVGFQGVAVDGGSAAVMEGNRIFNCRVGGIWHDTYSSKSVIARNNYYRAVITGPYQNLGGVSGATPASTLTHLGVTATCTLNSSLPHGFTVGQGVRIQGAKVGGIDPLPGTYYGVYPVDSLPTPTSFNYKMDNDPGQNADSSPVPTVQALWQVQQCIIENNVIELIPSINYWGIPIGIDLLARPAAAFSAFRTFRRVVIRNNVIRYADNLTEDVALALGIDLNFCEDALVENNVVDLAIANPIRHRDSTLVRYFNNRNSAGQLIQGALEQPPGATPVKQDELTTFIEDATTVCIL